MYRSKDGVRQGFRSAGPKALADHIQVAVGRVWREGGVLKNEGGIEAGEGPQVAAANSSEEGGDGGGAQAAVGVRDK